MRIKTLVTFGHRAFVILVPILLGLAVVVTASAESMPISQPPVNNGSFGGPGISDVVYTNVIQNSVTDVIPANDPGPYGEPALIGNQLSFNAPSFAAISNPGISHDMTDGFLGFGMEAVDGYAITTIDVYEFGAVQLHSDSGGSLQTWTSVLAPVFIEVVDVVLANGSILPVPDVMFTAEDVYITPDVGTLGWDSLNNPEVTQWIGSLQIDLIAEIVEDYPDFVAQNDIVGVNSLNLTMNNILTSAVEQFNSFAFVDKKHADIRPGIVAVPEPTSATLLATLGILALLQSRRKK